MYRTDVYFLSKTMAELFIYIACPIITIIIPYYIVGFTPDVERFLICSAIMVLATNVATSFSIYYIYFSMTLYTIDPITFSEKLKGHCLKK